MPRFCVSRGKVVVYLHLACHPFKIDDADDLDAVSVSLRLFGLHQFHLGLNFVSVSETNYVYRTYFTIAEKKKESTIVDLPRHICVLICPYSDLISATHNSSPFSPFRIFSFFRPATLNLAFFIARTIVSCILQLLRC